jgi:predicted dehydrogenase
MRELERRDLLKIGALAGLGAATGGLSAGADAKPVRVGLVGTGNRGTDHIHELLKQDGVSIKALCDIDEARLARAQDLVAKSGQPRPVGYSKGETDYRRLCERDDLDLVMNATPWQYHTPICLAAMNAGKHAATEVPAALTIDECWQLVETSEKTGKHCVMLENDCYYRETLLALNMIQDGLLGEPLYAEAGYLHDIRAVKFNTVPVAEPWRLDHSIRRNGNLYPTHPIGPLSMWFGINRGDQFSYLVSMSSKSRSLKKFATTHFGPNDPRAKTNYALGDVNTTIIKTEMGRTICLYHDTNTPRPKENMARIQGTKGVYSPRRDKIFIEGRSNFNDGENWRGSHSWESTDEYKKLYDHKLWKTRGPLAEGSGHGGIDYLLIYRLIKNLQQGTPLDMDVYDAAAWSVIVPLSEASVAERSMPMDFPDFTRGKWKTRARIDAKDIV